MACPGGCLNGAQPIVDAKTKMEIGMGERPRPSMKRIRMLIRKSHENPMVKKIYEEYFKEPNSYKAHMLLHTHYTKRENSIKKTEAYMDTADP